MKKPNVLLILADQHRRDCIGCYGNPDVRTPNLDALAEDGIRYDRHYTVYPVCTPSRYSMLSGQYVHQHCAWTNESTLPGGTATFPKLLRENGYRTAAVGKMHFTPTYQDVGFDTMVLAEQNGRGRFEDDYHTYLMECGLTDDLDLTDQVDGFREKASAGYFDSFGAAESNLDREHHSTSWITRQALSQLEQWAPDGGNLLMVGYIKPHHPFDPPAPYSGMYPPAELTLPAGYTPEVPEADYRNHPGFFDHKALTEDRLRRVVSHYYGAITHIDDCVGEIVALLRKKGMYDDTMIIYTSDHGEYLGYHHMLLKGNFLYDPLAGIPLIIKYPGDLRRHGTEGGLCENIDLAATILDCCGVPPAASMCGVSLKDHFEGRGFVFSEGQYGTDRNPRHGYMIRSRDYKLIVDGSFERELFFDLRRDPAELVNLSGDPAYREEAARHRQALIEKMLFSGVSKNYCDPAAPQRRFQPALDSRSAALRNFVNRTVKIQ